MSCVWLTVNFGQWTLVTITPCGKIYSHDNIASVDIRLLKSQRMLHGHTVDLTLCFPRVLLSYVFPSVPKSYNFYLLRHL